MIEHNEKLSNSLKFKNSKITLFAYSKNKINVRIAKHSSSYNIRVLYYKTELFYSLIFHSKQFNSKNKFSNFRLNY